MFGVLGVFWLPSLWDLISLTRDEPGPTTVKAVNLNHWTTREFSNFGFEDKQPKFPLISDGHSLAYHTADKKKKGISLKYTRM